MHRHVQVAHPVRHANANATAQEPCVAGAEGDVAHYTSDAGIKVVRSRPTGNRGRGTSRGAMSAMLLCVRVSLLLQHLLEYYQAQYRLVRLKAIQNGLFPASFIATFCLFKVAFTLVRFTQ